MRKLASIQRVNAVEPIEGADAIERIRVLGWYVVTKKGDFQVGDPCVYVEIDALMPDRPEFEFLRARSNMRIKTAKLRGQVSQGIAFPLSILPSDASSGYGDWREGDDVTEVMGIVKYEPPIPTCLAGKVKGAFPGFVPKTDETRVQTCEGVLARHAGRLCYFTEKVDGSSATLYLRGGEFGVCSRTLDLAEDYGNSFWQVAQRDGIAEKLRQYAAESGQELTLQGELVGPGIQGNKLKLPAHKILFFNAYDNGASRYLDHADFLGVMEDLGLESVPLLGALVLEHTIDQLVELATRKSAINPAVEAEGIVVRPVVEEQDPELGRLSFKAINPRFLLKFDE